MTRPYVSVIIPCYNQGHFLGEAIESALRQSYRPIEVIVIDDGSTDDSGQVARRYAEIKLIRQTNRGLSTARNAGLAASGSPYLVFLDADDMLLGGALQAGVSVLERNPECAFTYGHYRLITSDGRPMPAAVASLERQTTYAEMLRRNFIGMHGTVMYRQTALRATGGFDARLGACEDYDVYLRMMRRFPICRHDQLVAEYRQHQSNMSLDAGLMLKAALRVLGEQCKHIKQDPQARRAYTEGVKYWQEYYGRKLIKAVRSQAKAGDWTKALRGALTLSRYYPQIVVRGIRRRILKNNDTKASTLFKVTDSLKWEDRISHASSEDLNTHKG